MPGVRDIKLRFQRLKQALPTIAEHSVDERKEDYVEAQRAQLSGGLTSQGGTFRRYANKEYARKKNQMNPLAGLGNPDLKYTGSFYRGIGAKVFGGSLKVFSTDSKAPALEADYGKDKIYGLYPEEMRDFIQNKVKPTFQKNILSNLKS